MTLLGSIQSTIKNVKQAAGIGNANFIPFVNFGTGSPAPVRSTQPAAAPVSQVQGASTSFIGPQLPYQPSQPARTNNIPSNSQSNFDSGIQNVQDQGNQGLDFIDQDYNNALGALAGQEQQLNQGASNASGQIESSAASTQNELRNSQTSQETGVQGQVQTAEKGGQSAMQQARDLFRQTQQSNNAQLSALGISSSSVSEALAERLGVETARRIAGVTGSIQEVRDNAAKELSRIGQYYEGKRNDLTNWVNNEKANIQQTLMAGLNQINSARNQAATDKSRSRAELINNVQSAIQNLTQQQQQYQQSLDAWNTQKTSALQPLVTDPNFLQTLSNTTNTLNSQFAPTGFAYAPDFNTNGQGQLSGQIKYGLNKKPEEDLATKYGL